MRNLSIAGAQNKKRQLDKRSFVSGRRYPVETCPFEDETVLAIANVIAKEFGFTQQLRKVSQRLQ